MRFEPRFYENWEDDNHCVQAAVVIVLNTLNGPVSWEEVNEETQYEDSLYTWTPTAAIVVAGKINGTKLISSMDYEQFAARGEEYFKEFNVAIPGWFEVQKKHASAGFQKERKAAGEALGKNLIEKRNVTLEEIDSLLTANILIVLVDAGRLAGENRNVGHAVVVYGENDKNFWIHDPGLPPRRGWLVDKQQFMGSFKNELILVPKGNIQFGQDVSRNDPCPCGSGKKFKKCHGFTL